MASRPWPPCARGGAEFYHLCGGWAVVVEGRVLTKRRLFLVSSRIEWFFLKLRAKIRATLDKTKTTTAKRST